VRDLCRYIELAGSSVIQASTVRLSVAYSTSHTAPAASLTPYLFVKSVYLVMVPPLASSVASINACSHLSGFVSHPNSQFLTFVTGRVILRFPALASDLNLTMRVGTARFAPQATASKLRSCFPSRGYVCGHLEVNSRKSPSKPTVSPGAPLVRVVWPPPDAKFFSQVALAYDLAIALFSQTAHDLTSSFPAHSLATLTSAPLPASINIPATPSDYIVAFACLKFGLAH